MNPDERRRRRLVIERGFQFRLALKVCLIASGMFVAFGGALLFIIKMDYEMLIQNALLQMPEMVGQMQREFRVVSLGIVSALILMIGVMFGLGLILTQQLAAPLFAFKRQLREFADGKQGVRLSLRTDDEFAQLAEVFNEAMERSDERRLKQDEGIRSALAALSAGNVSKANDSLQKTLKAHGAGQ